jgi:hypothetical protein
MNLSDFIITCFCSIDNMLLVVAQDSLQVMREPHTRRMTCQGWASPMRSCFGTVDTPTGSVLTREMMPDFWRID